jgi:hypothetical protein
MTKEVARMRRLTRTFPLLIASALIAVVLAAQGQGKASEVVTCSSDAARPKGRNLTGTWRANDKKTYVIRQIGTCVWWAGSSGKRVENVFFGTVSSSGSTVFGVWAVVRPFAKNVRGTVILSVMSATRLHRQAGGGPAFDWTR